MIKKIVLIGPESTGKTTLVRQLAAHYKTTWVAEFARTYIATLHRPYEEKDLVEIGKGQMEWEDKAVQKAQHYLFCDTDLRVLKIWSLNSYQSCDKWVLEQIEKRKYDLYLLCGVDVPWEYDPQREHPHLRQHFYEIYKKELQDAQQNFVEIQGNKEERLRKAIKLVDSL